MLNAIDPVAQASGHTGTPRAPDGGLTDEVTGTFGANRPNALHEALLESRHRWRDLVNLCADLAFETDAQGRFTFLTPDPLLGWPTATLLGQPAGLLLAETAGMPGFDPFRPLARTRGRRAWLKRPDGGHVCLIFSSAPLLDSAGQIIGARGVGQDITEQDSHEASLAATLRRSQVVDHILSSMHKEVAGLADDEGGAFRACDRNGRRGGVVVDMLGDGVQASLLHQVGVPPAPVLHNAMTLLEGNPEQPSYSPANDGRWTLVCPVQSTGAEQAALALWRPLGGRAWDADDLMLAASANGIIPGDPAA